MDEVLAARNQPTRLLPPEGTPNGRGSTLTPYEDNLPVQRGTDLLDDFILSEGEEALPSELRGIWGRLLRQELSPEALREAGRKIGEPEVTSITDGIAASSMPRTPGTRCPPKSASTPSTGAPSKPAAPSTPPPTMTGKPG